MLHWSLLNEYYSFCILIILFIRYSLYERSVAQTKRRKLFARCLLLSIAFIVLNVVCVVSLKHPDIVPREINILLNTLYFLVSIIICSLYAFLLFDALLEHVYNKHCLVRAKIVLYVITGLASILTVVNIFTGVVFSIDEAGVYHRGPLNRAYYLFMITEMIFVCICYIRNRASVSDKARYVIRSLPLVILLISLLQVIFPNVLLNGTICAIASLMIFIAFRSNTDEHDALTSANSRKAFMNELVLRSGSRQSVHILQVSIVNIADINTRYNHVVGDALLYEVAQYLRHFILHAQVFRTGGSTFTLLLPLTDDADAETTVQAIRVRLQSEWIMGDVRCHLEFAIADLRYSEMSGAPAEIVEQIEYTTMIAKKDGPIVRFDDSVRLQMRHRSDLLALMRRSIDEHRFKVNYQPLYCCHKDIFCSAEALLRLADDSGAYISPEIFIPLAEENNMIDELTLIVMEDACSILKTDKYPGLQSVSINLSMKQLLDPELPMRMRKYLDERGVSPDRIKVEITERFILHDAEYAKKQLNAMRDLGIQIYMDDFGTGYSNLSNVLMYPFSHIKIDRSLIAPLESGNPHASAMVKALIKLFQDMDKRVVAEGVETEAQVKLLRDMGIDMIQGYYFARPTDKESLVQSFIE